MKERVCAVFFRRCEVCDAPFTLRGEARTSLYYDDLAKAYRKVGFRLRCPNPDCISRGAYTVPGSVSSAVGPHSKIFTLRCINCTKYFPSRFMPAGHGSRKVFCSDRCNEDYSRIDQERAMCSVEFCRCKYCDIFFMQKNLRPGRAYLYWFVDDGIVTKRFCSNACKNKWKELWALHKRYRDVPAARRQSFIEAKLAHLSLKRLLTERRKTNESETY